MIQSPGIISCKNKVLKYSSHIIIFYENGHVYKQYPFNKYMWVNEIFIVNSLNHPNIVKFEKCEILKDNVIDAKNKEICLDQKEYVMRVTMRKYKSTLDKIKTFSDTNVIYIINALISANMYCNSKKILHRDIKESNILIDYTTDNNINHITNIALADFGISKYKYNIPATCRSNVITISHKPPELQGDTKMITYDERIDVWSFCVVLTYLITGKSLYTFILNGYTGICNDILTNITKLKIAITHFLLIYVNPELYHIDLYKKILKHGLTSYKNRYTFTKINKICNAYAIDHKLNYYNKEYYHTGSPEQIPKKIFLVWVNEMHNVLQHHDCVFYTFIQLLNNCIKPMIPITNEIYLLSIYIISVYLIYDTPLSITEYIQMAKYCIKNPNKNLITHEKIEYTISNIAKVNEYNIMRNIPCAVFC
jgi:serine/threonine protein kinase